eukprot:TRINITY_DN46825_c0_g1_i1.p2 TRINITY_DN46825_c0_g1~~TRINITY_DN46825_c0_g1_i1.p2  ORF type:complete len:455 (+),score=162.47 TRINITY_DN46825_c0_g1_i1:51-1415(+)
MRTPVPSPAPVAATPPRGAATPPLSSPGLGAVAVLGNGPPIGLGDALSKIRELKAELRSQEDSFQQRMDQLTDRFAAREAEHLAAQQRLLQHAREREALLIGSDAQSIRAAAARDARRDCEDERRQLEEDAAELRGRLADAVGELRHCRSELEVARKTVRREADASSLLRRALEREREIADAAREAADQARFEAQPLPPSSGPLQASAQRASAVAAALGELLGTVRQSLGAAAVDGAIHRGLRVGAAVARANEAGVDVAALLARHLRGFDAERAAHNQRRLAGASRRLSAAAAPERTMPRPLASPPSSPAHSPILGDDAGGAQPRPAPEPDSAVSPARRPRRSRQPPATAPLQSRQRQRSTEARCPPPALDDGRGAATEQQREPAPAVGAHRTPAGCADAWPAPDPLAEGGLMVAPRRQAMLQRALRLQRAGLQLRRSRSVESARWSPPPPPRR